MGRCVKILGEKIIDGLPNFAEEDIVAVSGSYIVSFLDDSQRRLFLARCADLRVGLLEGSSAEAVKSMKELEQTVRRHSFAFIASLPDSHKDYLMRLKGAGN